MSEIDTTMIQLDCRPGLRTIANCRVKTIVMLKIQNTSAIERQLAHAERNAVSAAYNFAEHLPERRKIMQALADIWIG